MKLKDNIEAAWISCWLHGPSHHPGLERLPPRLWEPLRQLLQGIYRRATGEEMATLKIEDQGHETARPIDEWHEDFGYAVWWTFKDGDWLGEPSYIGSPLCDDWPGYHTHWTPHPKFPAAPSPEQETPAACDHAGWDFGTNGRSCIKCGAILADFGD